MCFSCLLSLPFLSVWANDEEDTGEDGADDFQGIHLSGNGSNGLNLLIMNDQGPMPLFGTGVTESDDGDFFNRLQADLANNRGEPVIVLDFDLPQPDFTVFNLLNDQRQGDALNMDALHAALTDPASFLSIY